MLLDRGGGARPVLYAAVLRQRLKSVHLAAPAERPLGCGDAGLVVSEPVGCGTVATFTRAHRGDF